MKFYSVWKTLSVTTIYIFSIFGSMILSSTACLLLSFPFLLIISAYEIGEIISVIVILLIHIPVCYIYYRYINFDKKSVLETTEGVSSYEAIQIVQLNRYLVIYPAISGLAVSAYIFLFIFLNVNYDIFKNIDKLNMSNVLFDAFLFGFENVIKSVAFDILEVFNIKISYVYASSFYERFITASIRTIISIFLIGGLFNMIKARRILYNHIIYVLCAHSGAGIINLFIGFSYFILIVSIIS